MTNLLARAWWTVVDTAAMIGLHARVVSFPRVPKHLADGDPSLPVIVMVPGVYEQWWFMEPFARRLNAAGYRIRFVGGLGYNLFAVLDTADRLARALSRTPAPAAGRIIVGHSKGGLIGKQLLRSNAPEIGLIGVVAVASPFAGARRAEHVFDPRLRIFSPVDETIVMLGKDASVNARIVSIYGRYDTHVPEGSVLADAINVQVNTTGHMTILKDAGAAEAVLDAVRQLSGGDDRPLTNPASR